MVIVRSIFAVGMCYWVATGSFYATAICLFFIFAGAEIELVNYKHKLKDFEIMERTVQVLRVEVGLIRKEYHEAEQGLHDNSH